MRSECRNGQACVGFDLPAAWRSRRPSRMPLQRRPTCRSRRSSCRPAPPSRPWRRSTRCAR